MKPMTPYFNMVRSHYDNGAGMMAYVYECCSCRTQTTTTGGNGSPKSCPVCSIEFEKIRAKCVRRLFLSTL